MLVPGLHNAYHDNKDDSQNKEYIYQTHLDKFISPLTAWCIDSHENNRE